MLEKQQECLWARPDFKSDGTRGIFRLFHFLGTLNFSNFSKNTPEHFIYGKLSDKKKPFEDSHSGFKNRF